MKLKINGEEHDSDCETLAELWATQTRDLDHEEAPSADSNPPRGFAIALNGRVVRRDDWSRQTLADGDRVEIIRAFAGG